MGWSGARSGLILHRIGTGEEKRDRQLLGSSLPAGIICMKHVEKSQSTWHDKFMALIRSGVSGVAVGSAGAVSKVKPQLSSKPPIPSLCYSA